MTDNIKLDEELAAYTDALLKDKSPSMPPSLEEDAHTVRMLKQIIAPDEPVSPAFQEHLRSKLEAEWAAQPRKKGKKRPPFRLTYSLAAAAAIVLVMGAIALIVSSSSETDLHGFAEGRIGVAFVLFAATLVGILFLWISHTNRQ